MKQIYTTEKQRKAYDIIIKKGKKDYFAEILHNFSIPEFHIKHHVQITVMPIFFRKTGGLENPQLHYIE